MNELLLEEFTALGIKYEQVTWDDTKNKEEKSIKRLLTQIGKIPFDKKQYKYFLVILQQTLYGQQREMHTKKTHSIDDRIVSIHQPHVRPIVRSKANAKVEFGAKTDVSISNGFAFLEEYSWDAYNEGTTLIATVGRYRKRTDVILKKCLPIKFIVIVPTGNG